MLPLHGQPGGLEGEDLHHSDQTPVRGDVEDGDADLQEARGE